MRKIYFIITAVLLGTWACNDEEFLTREPKALLTENQAFADKDVAFVVLADLYDRYTENQTITNWGEFCNFDEAFASNNGGYFRYTLIDYPFDWWSDWDYDYIRQLNLFIEKCRLSCRGCQAIITYLVKVILRYRIEERNTPNR